MTEKSFTPKAGLPQKFDFRASGSDRLAFSQGVLRDRWYESYSMVFDDDCRRITLRQPKNHFNEWFTATQIYDRFGWLSLVEQYEFKNHPRKRALVREILGDREIADFVLMQASGRSKTHPSMTGQCPDLLCYAPDLSDWFFCEAKYPREPLTPGQEALFPTLEQMSEQPIRMAIVR